MKNTEPGERHEIKSIAEMKVILGYGSQSDLRQVSDGCEEGHPAEGKIRVHVVVEPKPERECGVVGRAGPEAEVGRKAPACILRVYGPYWFGGPEGGIEKSNADQAYDQQAPRVVLMTIPLLARDGL